MFLAELLCELIKSQADRAPIKGTNHVNLNDFLTFLRYPCLRLICVHIDNNRTEYIFEKSLSKQALLLLVDAVSQHFVAITFFHTTAILRALWVSLNIR